jgi:hypothetical protein
VQNTTFSDIESNEYRLLDDSSIIIIGQQFDNTVISEDDSQTGSLVEIVNSGTIEVIEGEVDEDDDDEEEGDLYNTDNEPFRRTLSDSDDTITVNSS